MRGASGGAEVDAGAAASADGDIAGGGWWVAMNSGGLSTRLC